MHPHVYFSQRQAQPLQVHMVTKHTTLANERNLDAIGRVANRFHGQPSERPGEIDFNACAFSFTMLKCQVTLPWRSVTAPMVTP